MVMVKDLVRGIWGLGLTIDDLVDWSVVVIKITTTMNIVAKIVVVFDDAWW